MTASEGNTLTENYMKRQTNAVGRGSNIEKVTFEQFENKVKLNVQPLNHLFANLIKVTQQLVAQQLASFAPNN